MVGSQDFLDLLLSVLPPHKVMGSGWKSFNCPACGDKRSRFGLLVTTTGGFRAKCMNAGCDFNRQPTGWEPGNGIGGRPRKLFTLLGGSIRDISIDMLMRGQIYDSLGNPTSEAEVPKATHYFPEIPLPPGSVPLLEPGDHIDNPAYVKVLDFVLGRGEEIAVRHPYMWSPEYKHSVITPYPHMGRNVGYLVRDVRKNVNTRMWQKCHTDFVFNQESLMKSGRRAIVVEGVNDAIALSGLAVRGAKITKQQQLLLNLSGRDIVILPDFNPAGLSLIDDAEANNWLISTPDWDTDVDDATKAVARYGLLYVTESIMASAHRNYLKGRVRCKLNGKKRA